MASQETLRKETMQQHRGCRLNWEPEPMPLVRGLDKCVVVPLLWDWNVIELAVGWLNKDLHCSSFSDTDFTNNTSQAFCIGGKL